MSTANNKVKPKKFLPRKYDLHSEIADYNRGEFDYYVDSNGNYVPIPFKWDGDAIRQFVRRHEREYGTPKRRERTIKMAQEEDNQLDAGGRIVNAALREDKMMRQAHKASDLIKRAVTLAGEKRRGEGTRKLLNYSTYYNFPDDLSKRIGPFTDKGIDNKAKTVVLHKRRRHN